MGTVIGIGTGIGIQKKVQLGTNLNQNEVLPYTCDSTVITCDNREGLTVNGIATTIRNEFDLANQKMTLLYNNL